MAQNPGGVTADVHFRADAGTSATAVITSWTEQVSGVVATDANVGTGVIGYLENALNFNPSVVFSNQAFDAPIDLTVNTRPTVNIMAIYNQTTALAGGVWGNDSADFDRFLLNASGANDSYFATGVSPPGNGSGETFPELFANNSTGILTITNVFYNNVPNPNGSAIAHVNSIEVGNESTGFMDGTSDFRIGGISPLNTQLLYNGHIPEFIVFNGTLTAANRQQVESYLAIKYGVTLGQRLAVPSNVATNYVASNGTTVWSGDATYQNNITGLGNGALLDQRVSRSDRASTIMVMATDNDFVTANGGARTALDENAYVIVGDNNAATTVNTTTEQITGTVGRISREWRAQSTGANTTFFQLTGLAPLTGDQRYFLTTDSDGNFNSGAAVTNDLGLGPDVSFSQTFSAGTSFFTLAVVEATVSFVASEASINESATTLQVGVTIGNSVPGGFSLTTNTLFNDLASSADITSITPTALSFTGTANEVQTLTITIVSDSNIEGDERFSLSLGSVTPVSVPVSANDSITITIKEDAQTATIVYTDFGDVLSTGQHTIVNGLHLGANEPDHETSATVNASATGDDSTAADSIINLALLPDATPSSSSALFPISNLNDGRVTGANPNLAHTASIPTPNEWVEIDLGAEYTVTAIVVNNRDILQDRLQDINLLMSDTAFPGDGSTGAVNFQTALDVATFRLTDIADDNTQQELVRIDVGVQQNIRYVRLQHNNGPEQIINIFELQVWGEISNYDDEDALSTVPALPVIDNSYSLSIPVDNPSNDIAHVKAWVDFNNDGSFANDSVELRSSAALAAGSSQTLTLTWNSFSTAASGFNIGETRAIRIRVSSDSSMTATESLGAGETEDYILTLVGNAVTASVNRISATVNESATGFGYVCLEFR